MDKDKWKEVLRTPSGRSQADVENEINELYMKKKQLEDQIHKDTVEEIRKSKMAYMNQIYPNQQKDKQIPIDGDIKAGSRVFMLNCVSCHSLELFYKAQTEVRSSGPPLAKIYMSNAGANSLLDYQGYSAALMESRIVWNSYNLFNWMKNPQAMVKGTYCMKNRKTVESVEDRADLVKFLKSFSKAAVGLDRRANSKRKTYEMRNYTEQAQMKVRERITEELNK